MQQMLRTTRCRKSRFDVVVDHSTCEHQLSDEELLAVIFIGKSARGEICLLRGVFTFPSGCHNTLPIITFLKTSGLC